MGSAIDVLGKKWALIVVRDVAFLKIQTFNAIERHNPGLSSRMLARRLRELCDEGILYKLDDEQGPRYEATEKGQDALWILFAFLRYGLRHHPDKVEGNVDALDGRRPCNGQVTGGSLGRNRHQGRATWNR